MRTMTTNAIPADPFALSDSTLKELGAWARGVRVSISDVPQLAGDPEAAASCLTQFLALNGRRPVGSTTVSGPERALATWVKEQLRYGDSTVADLLSSYPPRRGRPSTATIPDQLTDLLGAPHHETPAQAEPTIEQLRDFIAAHGRRPSVSAENAAAQERALAEWVLDQRHDRTLGAEILTVLRGVPRHTPAGFVPATRRRARTAPAKAATPAQRRSAPGRARTSRLTSEQRLQELSAFCQKNGHRPSAASGDKAETSLAQWVYYYRATGETARAKLEEVLAPYPHRSKLPSPDPRPLARSPRRRATVEDRISELEQFLLDYGHRPRRRSEDKAERSLAEWVSQHQRLENPHPDLAKLIDERAAAERRAERVPATGSPTRPVSPPANARQSRQNREQRLTELKEFCAAHGRRPSHHQNATQQEQSLHHWIYKQLAYRSEVHSAVQEVLDQYPTFRQVRDQLAAARREERAAAVVPWPTNPQVMRRLEQLRAFVAEHGRVPARRNAPEAERHLADWSYRHTRLKHPHPEVMELLSTGGGYGDMEFVHSTQERFEQLVRFVETHDRLPRYNDEDAEETSLSTWLRQHRHRKNPNPEVLSLVERAGGLEPPPRPTTSRYEELALFCVLNGRLPSVSIAQVKSLARWTWQTSDRKHPGTVVGMLIAAYPTYRDVSRGAADLVSLSANSPARVRRLQELTQFRAMHRRMPSTEAAERTERSLAVWVNNAVNNTTPPPAILAMIHGAIGVGTGYEHRGRRLPRGVELPSKGED